MSWQVVTVETLVLKGIVTVETPVLRRTEEVDAWLVEFEEIETMTLGL